MKVSDLNGNIKNVKNQNSLSKSNEDKIRNALKNMFDVIERFEKDGSIDAKSNQKIDFLKDTIQSIIKDEDQKKIIKGGE